MDSVLSELAEHAFEHDLKRLDQPIAKQNKREHQRYQAINVELDLRGTELVDDLAPRFSANHRPGACSGEVESGSPTRTRSNRGICGVFRSDGKTFRRAPVAATVAGLGGIGAVQLVLHMFR